MKGNYYNFSNNKLVYIGTEIPPTMVYMKTSNLQVIVTAMHGGCNYFAVQVHNLYGNVIQLVATTQSVARRWTVK